MMERKKYTHTQEIAMQKFRMSHIQYRFVSILLIDTYIMYRRRNGHCENSYLLHRTIDGHKKYLHKKIEKEIERWKEEKKNITSAEYSSSHLFE